MVSPHAHDTTIFLGSITVFDAIYIQSGPPPFPRVFRAPTCEVCAMSLQDLINSQVSTFFAILARLAWIDWEKMQQTEVLLSNVGQPCRISPKKIRQF